MLATELPLFPLQNVVLFPGVFLPLHIFEACYRTMLADVLASNRMIGIVLLKPGWHDERETPPDVYAIGCVGLVTHVEQLPDGRYNVVLRGVEKFRLTGEREGKPYRIGRVAPIGEIMSADDHERVKGQRQRIEQLLTAAQTTELPFPLSLSDEEVVNALAQYLDLEVIERQALLEQPGVAARSTALIELLEMKAMTNGQQPDRGLVH